MLSEFPKIENFKNEPPKNVRSLVRRRTVYFPVITALPLSFVILAHKFAIVQQKCKYLYGERLRLSISVARNRRFDSHNGQCVLDIGRASLRPTLSENITDELPANCFVSNFELSYS